MGIASVCFTRDVRLDRTQNAKKIQAGMLLTGFRRFPPPDRRIRQVDQQTQFLQPDDHCVPGNICEPSLLTYHARNISPVFNTGINKRDRWTDAAFQVVQHKGVSAKGPVKCIDDLSIISCNVITIPLLIAKSFVPVLGVTNYPAVLGRNRRSGCSEPRYFISLPKILISRS